MFDTLQHICLAAALVFDTVLLVALLERRNWPFVRTPILWMALGAWLLHGGLFGLILLTDLAGAWPWHMQSVCMLATAAGLLLMPCGLLHGAWRVWQRKLEVQPSRRGMYALAYLPLAVLIPLAFSFFDPARGNLFAVTRPLELPYFLAIAVINLVAAAVFLQARQRVDVPQAGSFFLNLALVLIGMTALPWLVYLPARAFWPAGEEAARLIVILSPLVPALLFAYFVIRYSFMQIILERSLVYGALLGSILLFHQIAFEDVKGILPESFRLHVILLEALALTTLILAYQPFRQRTAEALRYLLGHRVSGIRERLRQLSRDLSAQAGRDPYDTLAWFVESLRKTLDVDFGAGWLFDPSGNITFRCGETKTWSDEGVSWLYQRMRSENLLACTHRRGVDREITHFLRKGAASLAVIKARPNVAGLLIMGRGRHNADLSEEETNAVLLLIEQLAITLDNSLLQAEQLAAQRKALQNEKLSALGLMASSIAHEIKNPLSAIKTIATVLAEDLGSDSRHAEDLRVILGEVDRLAGTTAQLLEIARPRNSPRAPALLPDVLEGTLRLLRHLANQQGIDIETRLAADLPPVRGDEQALREIFFNLLANSLEAAGQGGRVRIDCHRENGFVITQVSDSGPGLPEEVRARLFEPFSTTKQNGTGLGLYVVGQRVSELGGVIRCDSAPEQGTSFTVQLPVQTHAS
jgi:signal transduction histidine kinase